MPNITFKATGVVMHALEKILRVRLVVDGLENLEDTPSLFVVNHFTRMETFILPYVLYKHAHMEVRSLADASLFQGVFGRYLEGMGTLSTGEPLRNRTIIRDLITGTHHWVIYPEGVMVKNKKVTHRGKYHLHTPQIKRSPRTGAAVLALKAEMERKDYLDAESRGDAAALQYYEKRYGIPDDLKVVKKNIVVIPVNITYYPFRPGANLLSNLASALFKNIPERLAEELQVEGGILLQDTDMHIHFAKPIILSRYLDKPLAIASRFLPFIQGEKRADVLLWIQRTRLTNHFMDAIYGNVAIHIDHLFCAALRGFAQGGVREETLKKAMYLTALQIRKLQDRRVHPTLDKSSLKLLTDEPYPPYDDIVRFAEQEGLVRREGETFQVNLKILEEPHSFHRIRLDNPLGVITNEFEPLKAEIACMKQNVNTPEGSLRKALVREIEERDRNEFVADHEAYFEEGVSKSPLIGRPYLMRSRNRKIGFVLSHGFLSAPEEMRTMANYLNALGYPVYVVRLKGHGTAPRQFVDVRWEDWVHSFDRGYALMRQYCDSVIVGGFSSGGLLALRCAARKKGPIKAAFCINTPLVISDIRSRLVPAALLWNELLDKFRIDRGKFECVDNPTESPDINYDKIYLNGVYELNKMIDICRDALKAIHLPLLVIQGKQDPVISPKSADIIMNSVQSAIKECVMMDFDRHVIVRKEGSEKVFAAIHEFLVKYHLVE